MTEAHRLDCEKEAAECRFIVQSEDEDEAVALAKNHMHTVHGQDFSDDELRRQYLETV